MERNGLVGPYQGSSPREVYINVHKETKPEKRNAPIAKERNAPNKSMERSINKERSDKLDNELIEVDETEQDEPDDDGLTPKNRIFVVEYLRDFNATRAAIAAGYSKKTAYSIGWELLRKPQIEEAIKRHNELLLGEIGVSAQRFIMEYLKIAFGDVTDYVEFGQKEVPVMTMFGPMMEGEGDDKRPVTKIVNFVSFKESTEIDGTLISEVKQGKDGASIKLHDKMKALDVLSKYIDLLPDHHKRMIENEKLRIQQERLELDRAKAAGDGDLDEELIEEWVGAVMDDGDDTGDEEGDQ